MPHSGAVFRPSSAVLGIFLAEMYPHQKKWNFPQEQYSAGSQTFRSFRAHTREGEGASAPRGSPSPGRGLCSTPTVPLRERQVPEINFQSSKFWANFGPHSTKWPQTAYNEILRELVYYTGKCNIFKWYKTVKNEKLRSHNPEVVGSSPASATIKSPEIVRFQDFFLLFRGQKVQR